MFTQRRGFPVRECQTEYYAAGYLASHRQKRQLTKTLSRIQKGDDASRAQACPMKPAAGLPTSYCHRC